MPLRGSLLSKEATVLRLGKGEVEGMRYENLESKTLMKVKLPP